MKQGKPRKRHLTVVTLVLVWLALGLSLPLIVSVEDNAFEFDQGGVIAAPRGYYQIGAPIMLHGLSQVSLKSGGIKQVPPNGGESSGSEARKALEDGSAELVLDRVDMSLGRRIYADDAPPVTRYFSQSAPIVEALKSRRFASLTMRNSRLSITFPNGWSDRLFNVNLKILPRGRQGVRGTGTAIWRGQTLAISFDSGGVDQAGATMPFNIKVESQLLNVDFRGRIDSRTAPQLEGEVSIKSSNVNELPLLRRSILLSAGRAGPKTLSLTGPLKWTETALAFPKAQVEIDDNAAVGALALKGRASTPQVTGTLAFARLDLAPYILGHKKKKSEAKTMGWWSTLTSLWTPPLANQIEADLRISADETAIGETTLGKAAAAISYKKGKLSAQVAKLAFDGGSGNGQITIDYSGLIPRTMIRGRLTNAPLGDLASAILGARRIEGRATITADLDTQGNHLRTMLENMTGKLSLALVDGGAIGLDLNSLFKPTESASRLKPNEVIRVAAQGTTQVKELDIDFEFDSGRATCRLLVAKFNERVIRLAGRVDLPSQTWNLSAIAHQDMPQAEADAEKPPEKIVGRKITVRGTWSLPAMELTELLGEPKDFVADLQRTLQQNWVPRY